MKATPTPKILAVAVVAAVCGLFVRSDAHHAANCMNDYQNALGQNNQAYNACVSDCDTRPEGPERDECMMGCDLAKADADYQAGADLDVCLWEE